MQKKYEPPFYSFPKLKEKLISMGVVIGQAAPYTSVGTVTISPNEIGKRLFFENGNIYYIDDHGIKRRGVMYKAAYYFEYQGCISKPKFHVCQCSTIQNWGKNAYRFSNGEPVRIYSRNTHREESVSEMELCNNCKQMMIAEEKQKVSSSTDFVELLKKSGEIKENELDIFGYTKEWADISLAYRTKKKFTCERCGITLQSDFDRQYMQTHHKNGDKTDNREANLECLCIKCHSEINETHQRNFSRGGNKVQLANFIKKYQHR